MTTHTGDVSNFNHAWKGQLAVCDPAAPGLSPLPQEAVMRSHQSRLQQVSAGLALFVSLVIGGCDSATPDTSSPFSVHVQTDGTLVAPVAVYWLTTEDGTRSSLVSSGPCESLPDGQWRCGFDATPVAASGKLTLLLGETSEHCSLQSTDHTGCVWPVAFQNSEALTGTEASTVLSPIAEAQRLTPDALRMVWGNSTSEVDDTPMGAPGLAVELLEPLSGMRFLGSTGSNGTLIPKEGCSLWESHGCWMPPGPLWLVSATLHAKVLSPITTWDPQLAQPVPVLCPDQDQDGVLCSLCELESADCDDENDAVYPTADEDPDHTGLGDGLDNDCDGSTDEGTLVVDDDGDGFSEQAGDCDDTNAARFPNNPETLEDGVDQDCDGFDAIDLDNDGYWSDAAGGTDCDDTNPDIYPGATDILGDTIDANCDQHRDYLKRIAGIGTYQGEGYPALETPLSIAFGLTVDAAGRLWIADTENHRIRMIDDANRLWTKAGNGLGRFKGEDTPALDAELYQPGPMSLGPDGSLYFADIGNYRIRRIDPDGMISTVAGNGTAGSGGSHVLATETSIHLVGGLVVDSLGQIYFSEPTTSVVRRVDTEGLITTVAGTLYQPGSGGDGGQGTSAFLNTPYGLSVDSEDNVLIADTGNHQVRMLFQNGQIYRIAGTSQGFGGDGGAATSAFLNGPYDVQALPGGGYLIADTGNNRIRWVDATNQISTLAGNGSLSNTGDEGPAALATLSRPIVLERDEAGQLYLTSSDSYRIRMIDADHIIHSVAGNGTVGSSGNDGDALDARFYGPSDVAVDSAGNVFVADAGGGVVRRIEPSGRITAWAGRDEWGYSGDGGQGVEATLRNPNGLDIDSQDNLFIADKDNHRIRRVTPEGIITTVAGNGQPGSNGDYGDALQAQLNYPSDVAVDAAGNLFIADKLNHRIRRVDVETNMIITVAGNGAADFYGDGGPAIAAALDLPRSVAIDAAGNLYISDTLNARIRKVNPQGIISTYVGDGSYGIEWSEQGDGGLAVNAQLYLPGYLTVDSKGDLLLSHVSQAARIRKVSSDGIIYTVAGILTAGNGGEDGPATEAALSEPSGIDVGADGTLYIADKHSLRVLKVTP